MKEFNLALAFLLELCALAALAIWGAKTGSGAGAVVLAIAAPAAMAVVWGAFLSPRAAFPLHGPGKFIAATVVFALAAAALATTGSEIWGFALVFAFVLNQAMLAALGG
jgi:hypothetical protein